MSVSTDVIAATASGARRAEDRVDVTARALYEHELALHDARASHVDAWIKAAGDRVHDAVLAYLAARREDTDGR